jgi:hypothetical protein
MSVGKVFGEVIRLIERHGQLFDLPDKVKRQRDMKTHNEEYSAESIGRENRSVVGYSIQQDDYIENAAEKVKKICRFYINMQKVEESPVGVCDANWTRSYKC